MWYRNTIQTRAVAFRVNVPLIAVAKDSTTSTVIPAGSLVEWQPGDFAGGVATVLWLRRPVLVMEADLFKQCERMGKGVSI
jgi:hypothetical protein